MSRSGHFVAEQKAVIYLDLRGCDERQEEGRDEEGKLEAGTESRDVINE